MQNSQNEQRANLSVNSRQCISHDQWEMHVSLDNYPKINLEQYVQDGKRSPNTGEIHSHIHTLGVSPKLAGYHCLCAAISMIAEDPWLMMKEVYPVVARGCGLSNWSCVEHLIRTAIHKAWENRQIPIWERYFPVNKQGDIDRPSNKEFITRIANRL